MAKPRKPRPTTSPQRESGRSPYRDSPSRRAHDIEGGRYRDAEDSPYSPSRRKRRASYTQALASPSSVAGDLDPIMASQPTASDVRRKKSLVRPERQRINRDHPNYHYRKHAQNMEVYPSTTGNDPIIDDLDQAQRVSSEATTLNHLGTDRPYHDQFPRGRIPGTLEPLGRKRAPTKLTRKERKVRSEEEKRRQKELDAIRPPSLWNVYCATVTFWCPDVILKCFGKPAKAQRRAWREKMGLISIIIMICAFVGFLTFGFTQSVCGIQKLRLRTNHVDRGYMIFHGEAYNLVNSQHPAALGIPLDSNVLYDLPHKYGGQDGSFMFQKVNGACKGLITRAKGSDVPTNSDGDLAWYFPCTAFNQDGSSKPNLTIPYYLGYACHTTGGGRNSFYGLSSSGDVYFTWDDIRNQSRNLVVYSGNVIDLDLLAWFNASQVSHPPQFDDLRQNPDIKGLDITYAFQSGPDKQVGRCLSEIAKVGSVDTETVGCLASKVVLYVSLVFILSIVLVKFFLALAFQWFLSRRFAAAKTSQSSDPKQRNKLIEDWTDDIYRPAPRIIDTASTLAGSDRRNKRGSTIFPHTSRFTSPYEVERSRKTDRPTPTTMASQTSSARMMHPSSIYKYSANASQGTLDLLPRRSVSV